MNHNAQSGLFISLEGGEGSGKSTQIKRLQAYLAKILPSVEIVITREPGGTDTPAAEAIRQLLVTGTPDSLTAKTEALLMLASRVEHVKRFISPKLAQGAIILCDRFKDSSYVYQSITGGYDGDELRDLHQLSIGDITADRTFLFDLSPEEGLARAQGRESQTEARFEAKGLAYHNQVREGYLSLAQKEPDRFCIIDATQSEEDIAAILQQDITALLKAHKFLP